MEWELKKQRTLPSTPPLESPFSVPTSPTSTCHPFLLPKRRLVKESQHLLTTWCVPGTRPCLLTNTEQQIQLGPVQNRLFNTYLLSKWLNHHRHFTGQAGKPMNKGGLFRVTKQEFVLLQFVKPMGTSVHDPSFGMGFPYVPRKENKGHLRKLEL